MGIRPYSRGQVPVRAAPDSAETRFKPWVDDLEDAGAKTGEAWAEIDAKASSSNNSVSKLSADLTAAENRITALENLPLLLHWDGTGAKPTLSPGWALMNITNGTIEKG